MEIEKEFGQITYYEIDPTEDGFEELEGIQIDVLQITPGFRGEGKGRQLLQEAIKAINTEFPGQDIYLVACPKDQATDFSQLVEFYESEGFEVVSDDDRPYPLMKL